MVITRMVMALLKRVMPDPINSPAGRLALWLAHPTASGCRQTAFRSARRPWGRGFCGRLGAVGF